MTDDLPPHLARLVDELIDARLAARLTQAELARRLDVSQHTISRWEGLTRGTREYRIPSTAELVRWAEGLGLAVRLVALARREPDDSDR